MPRIAFRRLGALAAAVLLAGTVAACARSEPAPAAAASGATQTADGAVGPATGGGGTGAGPSDSLSLRADRGRIRGAESAKVWLIEISDFQCPYCKRWNDDVSATIDREYVQTGKVRHAFINFPIASIHPNAKGAAEAAMCASAQGRFWEMHDALFASQERWAKLGNPSSTFDSLAVAAKVNPAAWRACMSSRATAAMVEADLERSERAGVRSTPSFFIGNRGLVGSYPVDSFRVVLDAALANAAKR